MFSRSILGHLSQERLSLTLSPSDLPHPLGVVFRNPLPYSQPDLLLELLVVVEVEVEVVVVV